MKKPSLRALLRSAPPPRCRGSFAKKVVAPQVLRQLAEAEAAYTVLKEKEEANTQALRELLGVPTPHPADPPSAAHHRLMQALRQATSTGRLDDDHPLLEERFRLQQERSPIWNRRWDLRNAAGLDPRTGLPPVREKASNRAAGVDEGHYPDLLIETEELRRGCTEPESIRTGDPHILHTACFDGTFHHLRYREGGETVAGLTLHAGRLWRGKRKAVIDRVFTDPGHRRQGYAQVLFEYARGYFREVKHSKDLTSAGAAWKRAVDGKRR